MHKLTIALGYFALMCAMSAYSEDLDPSGPLPPANPQNLVIIKLKNGEIHKEETMEQMIDWFEKRGIAWNWIKASDTELRRH